MSQENVELGSDWSRLHALDAYLVWRGLEGTALFAIAGHDLATALIA